MSMLTPPGMGGKYRITGNRYPRMRRPRGRRRIVLAAVGAALALGLAGWGTLQLIDVFSGDDGKAKAAGSRSSDCPKTRGKTTPAKGSAPKAPAKALPKPADITVNVYNATKHSGLAKETAEELKKRGFKIGEWGNAPAAYDKKVKETGLLLGAPTAGNGAFDVLGAQLAGARIKNEDRAGKEIDLIIGDRFTDLTKPKDANRALAALTAPAPKPSPGHC